ncbi:MAG: T9SS type A sorting domain-containing protein, partial [Candidatus Cloacimonadota bacterium]|nr:T9SS type A sorting domain-containing protein [Candidatus Cloacimonadota bacterium]
LLARTPVINHVSPIYDPANSESDPMIREIDDAVLSDVLFDLQFQYDCYDASGEAGIETDGNFIYVPLWNGSDYLRYNLDGSFVEYFTVAGTASVRDLAYDGQYFYGAAANTSLFEMDFTPGAETLVSTITAPVACRAIAYDNAADGFWANNWSDTITLFDRSGTVLNTLTMSPTYISYYGFAYDDYSADGPFLWGFSQSVAGGILVQYDIAAGGETGVVFDVGTLVGSGGSAGGLFIAEGLWPGFVTIGCMVQNEYIVGLELCPGDEPWITVTPLTGTVAPGESMIVDVTLDAAGLGDITKTADIEIANNAGAPVVVDVTMIVENPVPVFDPPTNVAVDTGTGVLTWDAPAVGGVIIEDNMDSYSVGDYIGVVGDDWTTWSGTPGGADDALVTDVEASSTPNSVVVEENQDIVLIMDNYETGVYTYEMKMFVPTGYCGYFNLQKTNVPGTEWAFQIYFQTDGTALADAGAAGALTYAFNHDEWMELKIVVDLDTDWATYYHDGVEMIGYQYSLGCFGAGALLSFGGVNIFGGANSGGPGDTPMFYFDDVVLSSGAVRDLTGYNVYLDDMGTILETVGADVFEYTYVDLVNGQEYVAGVSAVYDAPAGESDIIEYPFEYDGEDSGDVIVAVTKLNGNYPNPFNPVTNIAYSIKEAGKVTLQVYNIKGQLVKTLVNDVRETGNYTVTWNGRDNTNKSVASGVYFYKMKAQNYNSTKKMILMK